MMHPLKHKPLAVLLGGLLIFSACKKDSDSNAGPAPVVDPLTVAAAKPNDTLTLKGQNFSTTATGNVVKIGDVEAIVVSVSATEIKIVIPAISTPGTYTITVTVNGKTTEVGSIVIAPLTFYVIKGNFATGAEYQVITINPSNGSESLVATLGQTADARINDVVYLNATNEIMGVNDDGNKLVKVNVTTKQVTTTVLTTNKNIEYAQLVVDNSNNLYAVKFEQVDANHYVQTLVKLDPATGNATVIKSFEHDEDWDALIYNPASNDVVGLIDEGTRLFKVNLTTKDTSSVSLSKSPDFEYDALVVDNKSNLYGYKNYYEMSTGGKIFKLNPATGQETLLVNLPADGKFHDKISFIPAYNEFISTWNQYGIMRINAATLNIVPLTLVTDYSRTYDYFTSN